MAVVSLIFSIIALVIACFAYTKSGGSTEDLKRKVEDLHLTTEGLRNKLADALEKAEKKVRGEEKKPGCTAEARGDAPQETQEEEHLN